MEKTEASVRKIWDDSNNQDGIRPASLTVKLLADGVDTEKTLTLNEANSWQGKLSDLDKYSEGKEIVYTWSEADVPEGYTLSDPSKEGTVTTLRAQQRVRFIEGENPSR